jgi:hypothetical protein
MRALANKEFDWDTDTIKIALMGTGYSFDDAHDFWNDISANDYGSATGYTAGGDTIATRAITQTDSSALTARVNSTAYVIGDIVRTATDSTRAFLCVVAGTSAASEPGGMATLGTLREIADGGVTWVNVGRAITILDGAANAWTGLDQTGTVAAVVYWDSTVATTSVLICAILFGQTETPTDLTVTPPGEGYVVMPSGAAL